MADLKKKFIGEDYQGLALRNIAAPVGDTDPATKASAQAQANAAKAAAETFATNAATTAKSEAISAAATDATTKAATAKSEAIAAAATDATSKAATAKSEAIAAAATDASNKATTAEANAKSHADDLVANLVNSAPETLNTLNELALALGNDQNFATTITDSLGTKTTKFGATITGTPTAVGGNFEYLVSHNLGKSDIVVQAFNGNDSVDVFVRKVNDNSLKIITGVALGLTELRVVVVG